MAFTKGNEDSARDRGECGIAMSRAKSSATSPGRRKTAWANGSTKKGTFYDSGMVIHQMLEAVSHDGNYAINIPLTPAGELDPGGVKTLQEMGDWMDVNSEGIHDSSAWDVWGEGTRRHERRQSGAGTGQDALHRRRTSVSPPRTARSMPI